MAMARGAAAAGPHEMGGWTAITVLGGQRRLIAGGLDIACAIGRGGLVDAAAKREGDGATPLGRFALRRVLARADRLGGLPASGLDVQAINAHDGWCDDPADAAYNRPVTLPYRARAEALWRADAAYDLIVVLGYNDAPVVAGRGSAIFLHAALPSPSGGWQPTAGCIAIARATLVALVRGLRPGDRIAITDV